MIHIDEFMQAAIDEARRGAREGGIPIGSVLVHRGRIIGRGHNQRVQRSSAVRARGVSVQVLQDAACIDLMAQFIRAHPELWNEDIGV